MADGVRQIAPDLQGLRRWLLATSDAHGLYAQYGFTPADPNRYMEIRDSDVYKRGRALGHVERNSGAVAVRVRVVIERWDVRRPLTQGASRCSW